MAGKRGEQSSPDVNNKLILKKAVHKRIEQIEAKAFISEREVYEFIRSFFKKYLGIDYEFTREELVKELKKVYLTPEIQKRVNDLFIKISEMEHSSHAFNKDELQGFLLDFKALVDDLIGSHYQKEKSFFRKFGDSVHRFFSRKHKKLLEIDESVLSGEERQVVRMNMLLDNAKRWCGSDLEKSKKAYSELLRIYNSLEPGRKNAYYKPVQELYNMIKVEEEPGMGHGQ